MRFNFAFGGWIGWISKVCFCLILVFGAASCGSKKGQLVPTTRQGSSVVPPKNTSVDELLAEFERKNAEIDRKLSEIRASWSSFSGTDEITRQPYRGVRLNLNDADFTSEPSSISVYCDVGGLYAVIYSSGFWGGVHTPRNRKVWLRVDNRVYETRYLHDVEGTAAWLVHAAQPRYRAKNATKILNSLKVAEELTVRVMDWKGGTHTSKAESPILRQDLLASVLGQCGT